MSILLIILLVIVLLAACILLIPIHISLELLKDGPSIRGFYRIRWMSITIVQNEIPRRLDGHGKAEPESKEDEGFEHAADAGTMISRKNLDLLKDALPSIASTIVDLIECISIKRLDLSIALGMSDPSETAILSGYIWSVSAALGGLWGHSIQLVPDFSGQRLDGSIITEIRIQLMMVAAASIKALSKEPLRKLIEGLVRENLVAKPQSS